MKGFRKISFAAILFFACVGTCFGFERGEHDQYLRDMLFGRWGFEISDDNFAVLSSASYLCIDQFNNGGREDLNRLRKAGVNGLPHDISSINFDGNSHHRRYTHKGWNSSYWRDDQAKWEIRKQILVSSVSKVFPSAGKDEADAVSALIYYIHILGDCLDSEDLKNYKWHIADQMPFAWPHPYDGNEDVCYEIGKHLDVLFKKSRSHSYNSLISQLDIIADEARNISGGAGGLTNDDEGDLPGSRYGRYHKRMEEYVGILKMELPGLLRQKFEEFSKPKSAGFLRKLHEMFF